MSEARYTFVPKPEVADWIDEHVDSWTSFCYESIYKKQRKEYQQRFERIGFRFFIVFMGMILISFSYATINVFNYLMLVTGGIAVIIFGFIMLGLEVSNGKRK